MVDSRGDFVPILQSYYKKDLTPGTRWSESLQLVFSSSRKQKGDSNFRRDEEKGNGHRYPQSGVVPCNGQ